MYKLEITDPAKAEALCLHLFWLEHKQYSHTRIMPAVGSYSFNIGPEMVLPNGAEIACIAGFSSEYAGSMNMDRRPSISTKKFVEGVTIHGRETLSDHKVLFDWFFIRLTSHPNAGDLLMHWVERLSESDFTNGRARAMADGSCNTVLLEMPYMMNFKRIGQPDNPYVEIVFGPGCYMTASSVLIAFLHKNGMALTIEEDTTYLNQQHVYNTYLAVLQHFMKMPDANGVIAYVGKNPEGPGRPERSIQVLEEFSPGFTLDTAIKDAVSNGDEVPSPSDMLRVVANTTHAIITEACARLHYDLNISAREEMDKLKKMFERV